MLLAGIIYGSPLSLGEQDLDLVGPVVANLEILAQYGDRDRLNHIKANCVALRNAAKNLLDRTGAQKDDMSEHAIQTSTFQEDQFGDWLYPNGNGLEIPAAGFDSVSMHQAGLDGFRHPNEIVSG